MTMMDGLAPVRRRPAGLAIAFFVVSSCLFWATSAHARLHEVQNIEGSLVPAGLSMEQVRKAIQRGGAKRGWIVRQTAPGHLIATLNVRKHMVQTDVTFDQSTYSITYRDSDNMKYTEGRIHGRYNSWVHNFDGDIQRELHLY